VLQSFKTVEKKYGEIDHSARSKPSSQGKLLKNNVLSSWFILNAASNANHMLIF